MFQNNMTTKQKDSKLFASVITLVIYCFGLSPIFIPHDHVHSHDNNNNDSAYCESISQNSDSHLDCKHEGHLQKEQEKCFLCDHSNFFDHFELRNVIVWTVQLPFIKNEQLVPSLYLQDPTNYSNKSPPFIT
jgi:hypothetical protein